MKHELIALARTVSDPTDRLNVVREYLQALIMRSLHESQAFRSIVFMGGTALRFLYNLPRYSEDLDFSRESADGYEPVLWMRKIKRDLSYQGYEVSVSWNATHTVHVAWVGFAGIMKEVGLSGHASEKISIKIEIDTNPPQGATMSSSIVNRHMLFAVRYHDLASLMAGKIHAILTRPFVKGRDWYDLLWYESRRPPIEPNPILLRAAMAQSGIEDYGDWRIMIKERSAQVDFGAIASDVAPFLEHHEDARLLTRENLMSLLGV
ncbi:MAG TPA: nucleotidyl transferase AbiEii/AbiGii toxin family protein [Rectinema sp.]|nr:nucleotidyl transferase AbiEii/AbiGii toxin family protein [Rectinema sp.]